MDPKTLIRQLLSVKILTRKQTRFIIALMLLSLVFSIFYTECFIITFEIVGGPGYFYDLLALIATYFLFNLLYNLMSAIFKDSSITNLMLVQRLGPDWSYCIRCESVRPPRAHHCRKCDVCIIRFDHHCSILGQCIGLANMKFFMNLLAQASVSCFIGTVFNLPYVYRHVYSDWSIWSILLCILNPTPFAFIGWLSVSQFFLCIMTSMCSALGPTLAVFFVYHLRQILRNQTSVEVLINNDRNPTEISYHDADMRPVNFDLGWRRNLEQVMGKRWLISFFLPFVSSQQTTDGLSYPVAPS
ncbi:hypothetical protein Aperf_G00000107614 [Anoplocephala perfoliata]